MFETMRSTEQSSMLYALAPPRMPVDDKPFTTKLNTNDLMTCCGTARNCHVKSASKTLNLEIKSDRAPDTTTATCSTTIALAANEVFRFHCAFFLYVAAGPETEIISPGQSLAVMWHQETKARLKRQNKN